MNPAPTSPADIAARAFTRRRGFAARQVGAGRSTPAEAEAKLAPWLALAAEAGADLPELYEAQEVIFPFAQSGQTIQRRRYANDISPRADRHATLARAAVAQLDAQALDPSNDNTTAARELLTLCRALGVRIPLPTELTVTERKSA